MSINNIVDGKTPEKDFDVVLSQLKIWFKDRENVVSDNEAESLARFMRRSSDEQFLQIYTTVQYATNVYNLFKVLPYVKKRAIEVAKTLNLTEKKEESNVSIDDIISGKTPEDFDVVFPKLKKWFAEARWVAANGKMDTFKLNQSDKGINILTRDEAQRLGDFVCRCNDEQVIELWHIFNTGVTGNLLKVHPFIHARAREACIGRPVESSNNQKESK